MTQKPRPRRSWSRTGSAHTLETAPPPDGVRVDTDLESGAVVSGNPDRLTRVLVNLLTNSYRHGGPSIVVSARTDAEHVTIVVEDDGPGVAAAILPQLFEPFTRSTSRGDSGNGLGLAIADGVVTNLGGRVSYETRAGGGARFVVQLPSTRSPRS